MSELDLEFDFNLVLHKYRTYFRNLSNFRVFLKSETAFKSLKKVDIGRLKGTEPINLR